MRVLIDAGFKSVLGCEQMLEVGAYSGLAYGAKVINLTPIKIGIYPGHRSQKF